MSTCYSDYGRGRLPAQNSALHYQNDKMLLINQQQKRPDLVDQALLYAFTFQLNSLITVILRFKRTINCYANVFSLILI
jgi:hypothetical protein